ncbi:hypothetical protein ADN00_09300 [Ornatilinea apprima]|uniref:O-antigen ligase-related domain-containing protein n=2 Tax=Ornatilinea apprima TaxID=1134406 RepID=A0A0P6XV25_9CHLR|nr:hypothetical protein ADN00_09300 [Ornatilinea apprima]
MASCIPAIFWSRSMISGVGQYIRIISPLIILFSMYQLVRSQRHIEITLKYMSLVTIATLTTMGLSLFQGVPTVVLSGIQRITGSGLFVQQFAKFVALNIEILLLYFTTIKRKLTLPLSIGLSSLSIILFLTYHRTSWLILFISIIMGAILFRKERLYWVILFGGSIAAIIFHDELINIILRFITPSSLEDINRISSSRFLLYTLYLREFANADPIHWLFGMGYGDPNQITDTVIGTYLPPHNDYIAYLVEAGIITLILYFAILISVTIYSLKNNQSENPQIKSLSRHTTIIVTLMLLAGIPGAFYGNVMSSWYLFALIGVFFAGVRIRKAQHFEDKA